MDTGLLLEALELASVKHRDQRRKDREKSPYINHPIAVARVLWAHGVTDPDVIIASVLHDTIEDTPTTREEIAAKFGESVAAIVAEVTDDKSLPKERRKQLQVDHAPHLSTSAKLVKLADKVCNLRDMVDSPPDDWSLERRRDYFAWSARVVAGLRGTHAALELAFDEQHARGPR
jgi:GTP diphosphokinase / guanosine-3',5'-bis(diphosphate) 3'-diphosphatase